MEDIKVQLANRLKEANNVLVSVTTNPTVDQFAAAIGLTLILNKLGKHATTVFSGTIPSTIEFLQPEKVVEKNTDSLRDFIISLDKAKADKLRYKIEDNFVKIFITPYHASISEKDLVFSQGDFNVDVVVGLGVHQREELDQAITAHGRILHDATVTTINTQPPSNLGSINWADGKSSSLCEMLVGLTDLLAKQGLLDTQISNALLTGIVAETQRFSNQKTTSSTMSASSKLLASGANQQLVATQLTPKPAPPPPPPKPATKPVEKPVVKPEIKKPAPVNLPKPTPPKKENQGELQIDHGPPKFGVAEDFQDFQESENLGPKVAQVQIDDQGTLIKMDENEPSHTEPAKEDPPKDPKPPELKPPEVPSDPIPEDNSSSNEPPPQPSPPVSPVSLPPVPIYTPPPLITIPADPIPVAQIESEPAQQPIPPPMQQAPPEPIVQVTPQVTQNPSASGDSSYLGGPKLVLQPPNDTNQLNGDEMGSEGENFVDPLSTTSENTTTAQTVQPILNHDSGPAEPSSAYQTQSAPPVFPPQPPIISAQPPVFPPSPPQVGDGTMPNLADVRNAVDAALSGGQPSVANQPLASLNSQPVNLNLTPPPQMPQQAGPLPPAPQPMAAPQGPVIDPTTGLEVGSSIPTSLISPTVAPVQDESMAAPPVPPPLIPPGDSSSLPPSFMAL